MNGGFMRFSKILMSLLLLAFASSVVAQGSSNEQDVVNRYLKKTVSEQTRKLGWISASYSLNRINKDNDYNKFASYESGNFSNSSVSALNQAHSFGAEGGLIFSSKIAWSVGGEYWMKQGQNANGSFSYTPSGGSPINVTDLVSEINVYGFSTGIQYYISSAPTAQDLNSSLAIRVGTGIGYYQASWDLWQGYDNLNLSTSSSNSQSNTFKGSAPGYNFSVGVDYPLNIMGLSAGVDINYLYLNFNNIAWYNSIDQEMVASYSTSTSNESRVDLGLSGVRAKIELKKFLSW
jgi:hypothetical protein